MTRQQPAPAAPAAPALSSPGFRPPAMPPSPIPEEGSEFEDSSSDVGSAERVRQRRAEQLVRSAEHKATMRAASVPEEADEDDGDDRTAEDEHGEQQQQHADEADDDDRQHEDDDDGGDGGDADQDGEAAFDAEADIPAVTVSREHAPVSAAMLAGGAGEDYCGGSTTVANCESKPSNWVGSRDTTKISVGMTSPTWSGQSRSQLYMAGSTTNWFNRNGEDDVVVTQLSTTPPSFRFTTTASSLKGQFSTLPEDQTPGCSYTATQVTCAPTTRVVTLDLSGFGSNDDLSISNVSEITNPIFLGGQGNDTLSGGNYTDDFMHDGIGNDIVDGLAGDDGFVNTSGADTIDGGVGDDLVESSSACEADILIGGNNVDSASWVQYRTGSDAGTESGVLASIYSGNVGRFEGGVLTCSGEGAMNSIDQFEDLEGSRHRDELRGDSSSNQLIGRASNDELNSYASQDRIIANSGDNDTIDCSLPANPAPGGVFPGGDIAFVDKPGYGADSVSGCENVTPALPIFADS